MTLQRRPSGAPSRSCADPGLRGFAGLRDGRRMHDLMSSARYRALWPHRALSRSGAIAFANTATGSREGMPFATLTASRGDRVIIDDPRFTEMVETERERTLRIFRESVTTRLNDPALRDRGNHAAPARARRNGRDPAARPGLRSPDAANGVRAGPRLPDAELCRSAHARRRIAVPGALPAYAPSATRSRSARTRWQASSNRGPPRERAGCSTGRPCAERPRRSTVPRSLKSRRSRAPIQRPRHPPALTSATVRHRVSVGGLMPELSLSCR
ncbi:hypothetical protein Mrad2831_0376 [Methylobacterium radiotolerans JCM 2831]|uniref:Uncharacterized protein n=1 Tax=Methylobacterium radiotolerans (strain ATCC 27329 / DSM 1819 / JCM 2831 / NBRC 15690 / NCIMB 10815 / 0-1) TaxID=426355 RepID=B1LT92_METRJ|nr:hypothetical protein Mrad2831_0376 [Methylobacterium radiotolerans JCM 2831]